MTTNNPIDVFRRTTDASAPTYRTHADEIDALMGITRDYVSKREERIAELVLAAVTAAGQITILNEIASQWVRGDTARFPLYAALDARDELLKAIQELGS